MISSDFAPNERFDDGLAALRILFQPWIWRRGTALTRIKIKIESYFPGSRSFLFLTGRAALYHVLQALTLKRGDEAVVVGFTCEAVVLPITALGLKPVYVDIEPDTYGPNVDDVQKKITKRTRVLILQHTFGIVPAHRAKLLEIAKKNDVIVIEDLAHGFAPGYFKKETEGTIKLLSFGRSKAVSSVFGGAIITSDGNLITRLKSIEKRLAQPSLFSSFERSNISFLLLSSGGRMTSSLARRSTLYSRQQTSLPVRLQPAKKRKIRRLLQ